MDNIIILLMLFFVISIVYSSVGFGGGSSYLAVMAIFSFSYILMPKVSLLCNIVVVTGGCAIYIKYGHLRIKKVIPVLLGSIPMSYIGGKININREVFLFLLGITLVIAASNMLIFNEKKNGPGPGKAAAGIITSRNNQMSGTSGTFPVYFEIIAGCIIGLISGLVGIGGGIILSPLLHLTGWGSSRQIAAASSFFILTNSIFGLIGQFSKSTPGKDMLLILPLAFTVFIGGQIGSRLGIGILSELWIKKTTALVVMFVGLRILYRLI